MTMPALSRPICTRSRRSESQHLPPCRPGCIRPARTPERLLHIENERDSLFAAEERREGVPLLRQIAFGLRRGRGANACADGCEELTGRTLRDFQREVGRG